MLNKTKSEMIRDSDDIPEIDRIIDRLQNLRLHADLVAMSSQRMVTRFFGTPFSDADEAGRVHDDSMVGKLNYEIDLILEILAELGSTMEKLSTL